MQPEIRDQEGEFHELLLPGSAIRHLVLTVDAADTLRLLVELEDGASVVRQGKEESAAMILGRFFTGHDHDAAGMEVAGEPIKAVVGVVPA